MIPHIQLDLGSFQDSLRKLKSVNRQENAVFLRRLAKELLKYLVQLTPPHAGHALTEKFSAQQRAGEQAIVGDVQKGFQPLDTLRFYTDPGANFGRRFAKLIRQRRLAEASELLRMSRIPIRTSGVIDEVSPYLHKKLRNKRGRITTTRPFLVVKRSSIKQRIAKLKKRVGYAKSGWKAAAIKLRFHLNKWISRHNAPGIYRESPWYHPNFTITMHNQVRNGVRFYTSIVPEALRRLHGSIKTQYTAIINKRHKAGVKRAERSGAFRYN